MTTKLKFHQYVIEEMEDLEYFVGLETQNRVSEHIEVDSSKDSLILEEISLLESVLALKGDPVKVSVSEGDTVYSLKNDDDKAEFIDTNLLNAYSALGFDGYDNRVQIPNTELSLRLNLPLSELNQEQKQFLDTQVLRISGHLVNLDNSTFDGLTGIYNRRAFETILAHEMNEIERNTGKNLELLEQNDYSLLMLDLDNFKKLNDTRGHKAGDDLLRKLGKTLKQNLRKSDVPARYGGEEFVVLLPKTNPEGAKLVAEKILASIRDISLEFDGPEDPYKPTASIGVYSVSQDASKSEDFRKHLEHAVHKADQALYSAKNSGKNKFVVYE
jgi:diguanylate cyclase (GGDEF)-like protein